MFGGEQKATVNEGSSDTGVADMDMTTTIIIVPNSTSGGDGGSQACDLGGSGDGGAGADTGASDTGSTTDTGVSDSGGMTDTGGTADSGVTDVGGMADSGGTADSGSGPDMSVDMGPPPGSEGSPCVMDLDCNNTCVESLTQPGQYSSFSQVCGNNNVCTRGSRLEYCNVPACVGDVLNSQTCAQGACIPDAPIEDCAAKPYQKTANDPVESGCYTCDELNPARCQLNSVNGAWGAWRPSTPNDDAVKNGRCGTDPDDTRVWHTHYCDNPSPSCGGIWCYWTTGAPGGPSSATEPEFRCGPL